MDEGQKDIAELREKIEAAGMPEDVKKEATKELNRLSRMSPMAADYSLTRNYIEWLAVLPWTKSSGGTKWTSPRRRRSWTRITTT